MRLHVDEVAAEQFLGALNGQIFGDVDIFATAVIAPPGISFGVLVGHDATLGFHDGTRNYVFRCDQFDLVLLAA